MYLWLHMTCIVLAHHKIQQMEQTSNVVSCSHSLLPASLSTIIGCPWDSGLLLDNLMSVTGQVVLTSLGRNYLHVHCLYYIIAIFFQLFHVKCLFQYWHFGNNIAMESFLNCFNRHHIIIYQSKMTDVMFQ